ncbi:MAG: diaminopimelate decarboxylase [Succinivibrionaceae bacterium]|nr:diaminopimelate decarboxylase [Succinivibrionaceae bacterium]
MDLFSYREGLLHAEDVPVDALARDYGTPLYVYSKGTLDRHCEAFEAALSGIPHLICYAVKANGNLAVLNLMARHGCGFDVVSEGELRRVIAAGGDPSRVVFSGVGKRREELAFALRQGIRCLNAESLPELAAISEVAADLGVVAPVAIRVNPDVDARTHPSISTGLRSNKFGIPIEEALGAYREAARDPHLSVQGIDCHIGSQMVSGAPILEALDRLLILLDGMQRDGIGVGHLDLGGGLGVIYGDEEPPSPQDFYSGIIERLRGRGLSLYIEPGRAMVANAGILLTRVVFKKQNGERRFLVVDAGMNDLVRPALYNSWMDIITARKGTGEGETCDVVGPVCESDDFLGRDRRLDAGEGDLLAVRGAGAYGSSMSSNYNARPLACEVMVDGSRVHVVRARQEFADMWKGESLLPGQSDAR